MSVDKSVLQREKESECMCEYGLRLNQPDYMETLKVTLSAKEHHTA